MTTDGSGETAHIISQVATLDDKIRELHTERAALLQKLNHIRSPMISRIPSEILSHIFWFAADPHDGIQAHDPHLSSSKGLFTLRRVCSHWRRMTDSSSQLWTTLTLKTRSYAQTLATNYPGLVKHYYQRLGAATMSVYISDFGRRLTPETVDKVIGIILREYPGKLRSLHLKNDDGSVRNAILKHAKGNIEFTQLESLDLSWSRGGEQRQNTLFCNSPCLRTLSLDSNGSLQPPLNFPWKQLTTLKLRGTSSKHAALLLTLCPNLVNHKFSYSDETAKPWPVATQPQITSMQFLRNLTWTSLDQSCKPLDFRFFERLRFPAVHRLKWTVPLPSDAPSVRDFFANMQALEELIFSPSEWEYCIDQHLGVFNSLTTLKACIYDDEGQGPPEWLHRLTVKPGKDNLFPRLQTLSLTYEDVRPHGLIVLLYSRRNAPVDWSDLEDDLEQLILPPYDPTSTHWRHHSRLLEFSCVAFDNQILQMDWTWSPHYGAMKAMISEAREVEGFKEVDRCESRILF